MAFRDRIEAFVADARKKAEGGFTLQELSQLLRSFIELAVNEARALELPGVDKKQYVLDAVGYLFDAIATAIPLGILTPVAWLVRPIIRRTVLVIADELIELFYKRLPPTPSLN